ncbi:Crp/Fnr family transcriptional regulator [Aquimarina sp. Aq107]|uniref:Crp/Fnr family transcriptional regulator n=1 Tax=Aquimarina sp. Aq107 TaxID=1191912 RepID=UPI000D54E578|nr:Crp/Fnr family transcriptional regulator [Aquimarina sp. Aq107]
MELKEYIIVNIDATFDGNLPFKSYKKKVKKGSVFTHFEQLEKKVYFLNEGIVQVEIKSKSEIKILDFFFKNSFFASYSSLLSNSPSDVCITAFTDCEVEIIEYQDLMAAYDSSLLANKLGRIETEKLYLRKVQREKELLTKTAEERYILLLSNHPQIIEQIPIKDISKYLGIQPESLSRIRKKIIS